MGPHQVKLCPLSMGSEQGSCWPFKGFQGVGTHEVGCSGPGSLFEMIGLMVFLVESPDLALGQLEGMRGLSCPLRLCGDRYHSYWEVPSTPPLLPTSTADPPPPH